MADTLTKEQIKAQKEKQAIASMKSAKDNMDAALARNSRLESCIANLNSLIDTMLDHIPEHSYQYESRKSNKEVFKERRASAVQYV